MQEEEPLALDWRDYRALAVRRRWAILAPVFLCWFVGWSAGWLLPARYRSEALILVEPQQVPLDNAPVSAAASDLAQQLPILTQRVLSRASLQSLVNRLPAEGNVPAQVRMERLRSGIEVRQEEGQSHKPLPAFHITYSAGSPQTARQVVEQVTALFIAENRAAQVERSEGAAQFLAEEVEAAQQAMAAQEARLEEFKTRHLGELPAQVQGNVQMTGSLQARAERLSEALNRAREQRLYLEAMASQYREAEAAQPAAEEAPELTRLRAQLAEARTRYTDANSYVRGLQAQIAAAERAHAGGVAQTAAGGKSILRAAGAQTAAGLMQVQGQIKANEQEIRDEERQLRETEEQLRQVQARLAAEPQYEPQLAELTRDYEQLKDNYESLHKKQMQTQLAANLESRQAGVRFVVLDPPSLATSAWWPSRWRFSLGGLGAGLLLGIGLALLLERLGNRIQNEHEAMQLMAHNVPGTVELIAPLVMVGIPRMPLPEEAARQRRRQRMELGLVSALCLAMAAANIFSLLRG